MADFGGFQYDRIFICFFQKRVAEKAFSALLIYRGKTNFYGIESKVNSTNRDMRNSPENNGINIPNIACNT